MHVTGTDTYFLPSCFASAGPPSGDLYLSLHRYSTRN